MPFPTYDKKADIPKGAEDVYEEVDGKWAPKMPDTTKLETTVDSLRAEKKQLEKDLKAARESTSDLQKKLDIAESKGELGAKEKKELLEKWEKDTAARVKEVQDKLDASDGKLRSIQLDDAAKKDFIAAGGRPEKADDALKLRKDRFDLVDGKLVVKDEKGAVSTVKPLDFWANDFKKTNPELFSGTKATGGGAAGGAGAKPGQTGSADVDAILKNPLGALKQANEEAAGT